MGEKKHVQSVSITVIWPFFVVVVILQNICNKMIHNCKMYWVTNVNLCGGLGNLGQLWPTG